MTEHLDADLLTRRAADMLGLHLTPDLGYLIHVKFTRQYHHIGKLRIEPQGLDIRDIQLCGEMYLLPHPVAIGHHGHIRGDDGGDARLFGSIDDLVHQGNILAVDDGVHRQVTLDAMLIAGGGNLLQVVDSERRGRVCPHVQFLDAEIDAVGTCLNSCCQRLT